MAKTVSISCQAAASVPYTKIKSFQGELKSLSRESLAKLKTLVLKNGVTAPIHVWKSKGELFNLDGHQRCRLFGQLEKDGWKIPPVPIVYVTAKDMKQAKQILLSNISQYGKIEGKGLYEFSIENGLTPEFMAEHFQLPNFDMPKFFDDFWEKGTDLGDVSILKPVNEPQGQELARSASNSVRMVQLFFSNQTHPEFAQKASALGEFYGKDNLTDTVMEAIREAHKNHHKK